MNKVFYTPLGAKIAIVGFILFCIFFKPISILLKITGINALMQAVGLLDDNGMFDFGVALIYSIAFILLFSIVGAVYVFFSDLKHKQYAKNNKYKRINFH